MDTSCTLHTLEKLSVAVPDNVLFQEVQGEAVLLNLESGEYYGLNEVGSQAWALFQQHLRLDQVIAALLERYQVSQETLKADLVAFLEDLESSDLVRLREDAT